MVYWISFSLMIFLNFKTSRPEQNCGINTQYINLWWGVKMNYLKPEKITHSGPKLSGLTDGMYLSCHIRVFSESFL